MENSLPGAARVVIIGGGIMGCSLAYHLTKLGWRDVLVLEQNQLTSGTTWHAAGLVGQLRPSHNLTRLAAYAAELYATLEKETGQATGFKQNGAITVAQSDARLHELKRMAAMARGFGLECETIGPAEIRSLHPLSETRDLKGAIWLPRDGQTNPTDTTQALAKGARQGGARFFEQVRVIAIETDNRRVTAVRTTSGRIRCEALAICSGLWSRDVGKLAGVAIPLHAAEHMYVVTEPMAEVPADLPVLRDYDSWIYAKEDAGKILTGGFEPVAKPWGMDGLPHDAPFQQLGEDWEHFEILMAGALKRLPILERAGIRQFLNGPESFTPDNRYYLGEAPELAGLYVGCGFNSIGIASAPGAGRALAEWIVGGEAPMDLWDVDIRRVEDFQVNARYLEERTVEALGLQYDMHWPYRQPKSARGLRRFATHERLAAAGAVFGVTVGWERPLYFDSEDSQAEPLYNYGRQHWWPHAAAEAKAAREGVALFELSAFGKFLLSGPDATRCLQWLAASDVNVVPGRIVYTQLLNDRGGIEADLTVTRVSEDRYLIIGGSGTRRRDLHWISRHLPEGANVHLADLTSASSIFGVMGPKSRELLQELTSEDLSTPAFPFSTSKEIDLASVRVRAQRLSYVGELGWEIHVPNDLALGLYDEIRSAGQAFGLRLAGMQAMDALRLEKGFRHWGHDIGPTDTALEAGLGFALAWDKAGGFKGRDALLQQKEKGIFRSLCLFSVEGDDVLLLHEEPIWRNGLRVGATTSGNRAHTLGRAMAFGYVRREDGPIDRDWLASGTYEIEIAGERFAANLHLSAPYDPRGARMRA